MNNYKLAMHSEQIRKEILLGILFPTVFRTVKRVNINLS